MVLQLTMTGCTIQTIAEDFHCCRDTIEDRFRLQIEQSRAEAQQAAWWVWLAQT
jgi:hypothetical protein